VIGSCIDINTQKVTALIVSTINPPIYLQDLVAQYGTPDAVTWGYSNISRTTFWFAEGIATSVNIYEQNRMLDYGQIDFVVYFPYQMNEGFEERWPYNRTNSENPVSGDRVYDPPPSEAQNPFDFEAMIATITVQPTCTPTPTPIDATNAHLATFPEELLCTNQVDDQRSLGPTWLNITIGQSDSAAIDHIVAELSADYTFLSNDSDDLRYVLGAIDTDPRIPRAIRFCLREDKVQAVSFFYDGYLAQLYLSEFVSQFEEPDAVTWTSTSTTRILFWFEHGVAVEATHMQLGAVPLGTVTRVILFPYQDIEGYESLWPYNQTRKFNEFLPSPEYLDFGPENPFDFEAMIATITAEPSRTPTPTFTPRPPTTTTTETS
jgi:hypothetical protein